MKNIFFDYMFYKKLQHNELISWIRLIRTNNIGEITFYSLLKIYGSASAVINDWHNLSCNSRSIKKNLDLFSLSEAEKEFELVSKIGGHFIACCESTYPPLLRHIKGAPPLITALGNLALLNYENNIAIVGSRTPTMNSVRFSEKIAYDLASVGFTIISGLASGIDTAAHSVILRSLPTIAVMATGIDLCYPHKNKLLYDKIALGGLCITELPIGTYAKAQFFPKRNRIVSGLSKGVLVVEAKKHSGSLITARTALEQNREVFAVPGFPIDERFSGNNFLLKEGATLVENANDVIHTLSYARTTSKENDFSALLDKESNKKLHEFDHEIIEKVKTLLLNQLSFEPSDLEQLIYNLNIEIDLITVAIVELEIEGLVERMPPNDIALKFSC